MQLTKEQQLFYKYNLINTKSFIKNQKLSELLKLNKLPRVKLTNPLPNKFLVLLHGSYKCNAKCVYCEHRLLKETYNNALITTDIINDLLQKLGPNITEITWHGGESLLLPDNLLIYTEQRKKDLNLTFPTTLQTNLIAMTEQKKQLLDNLNISWGTSFDGINNTKSRGKNSTNAILKALDCGWLDDHGYIEVLYTDSIDDIIKNYEYEKSLGITEKQSCVVREAIKDNENVQLIDNNIAVKNMLQYADYWIHDTNSPIFDNYLSRSIERVLGYSSLCEDIFCLGGWLIIDPLGNIGLCGHSVIDDPICNLKDITCANDLFTHKNYLEIYSKQQRLLNTFCHSCIFFPVCYGGCMGLNYEIDHNYNTINKRNCQYTKQWLLGLTDLILDIDIHQTKNYNPQFINLLLQNNYYSLTEIKQLEGEY